MTFSEEYEHYKTDTNQNSRKAFQSLTNICPLNVPASNYSLIDLGCGTRGIPASLSLGLPLSSNYIGIEQFDRETSLEVGHFEKLSYLDENWTSKIVDKIKFNNKILISTFSLDVYPTKEKRQLIFKQISELGVSHIITSGFFYEGNYNARITELDITVSQNLNTYDEVPEYKQAGCVVLPCSSMMFGNNVYNVWRIYSVLS